MRQLVLYGRDGLPVLSTNGEQLEGWVTTENVLQAVAHYMSAPQVGAASANLATGPARPDPGRPGWDSAPTCSAATGWSRSPWPNSPAAGQPLGETAWPHGWVPVSVLDDRRLRDPDPGHDRRSRRPHQPARPRAARSRPPVPPDEPGTGPGRAVGTPPPAGQQP